MIDDDNPSSWWGRFTSALPMRGALVAVAAVWALGCVWSFEEQTAFARSMGFLFPFLLPLVIDGLAASMAAVAWAASLDARPAIPARLATVAAVAASSASNGVWANERTHNPVAVAVAVGIPVAANLAFEVLLAELRRQVQRRRGLPPPVAVPYPRAIRVVLSPFRTFAEWRRMVLTLTALEKPATAATSLATKAGEPAGENRAPKRASTRAKKRPRRRRKTRATPVDEERAAELIAQGIGRRGLANHLDITEHQARELLRAARNDNHQPVHDAAREEVPA